MGNAGAPADLATYIRRLRLDREWSVAAAARECELTYWQLYSLERTAHRERVPSAKILNGICKGYDINMADVMAVMGYDVASGGRDGAS